MIGGVDLLFCTGCQWFRACVIRSVVTFTILRGVKAWVSKHLTIIIFMMGGASVFIETVDYHMIIQGYVIKNLGHTNITCVNKPSLTLEIFPVHY